MKDRNALCIISNEYKKRALSTHYASRITHHGFLELLKIEFLILCAPSLNRLYSFFAQTNSVPSIASPNIMTIIPGPGIPGIASNNPNNKIVNPIAAIISRFACLNVVIMGSLLSFSLSFSTFWIILSPSLISP